jgi:tRNA nucleotidyltransferase (CCA-adding enzyme)
MKLNMTTPFVIPKSAHHLMTLLEDKGFEVYIIGGYVRDHLIHRPSSDIDMATNASPTQMIEIFKDYTLSRIGEKLGTIGVKIQSHWIEITTYRSESTSSNFRHPDEVRFIGSLKDDVLRRDFTINAMAVNIYGNLIDYTDGLIDLKKKQIKAIGYPEDRFTEDALRLLRALRFSAQLRFNIERETSLAILKKQDLITTLPVERISVELDKLICAPRIQTIFETYHELLSRCISFNSTLLLWVEHFDARELKYLCLLNHLRVEEIRAELLRLKLGKSFIQKVCDLKVLTETQTKDLYEIKVLLGHYGAELVQMALSYQNSLNINGIDPEIVKRCLSENLCVSLKTLALNGDDLMALGLSGKKLKTILDGLLEKVMREEIKNEKTYLLLGAIKELP